MANTTPKVAKNAEEEKWMAESDARTLAEADAIRQDPGRMEKAKKAAKRMLEEEQDRVNGLAKVANARLKYDTME